MVEGKQRRCPKCTAPHASSNSLGYCEVCYNAWIFDLRQQIDEYDYSNSWFSPDPQYLTEEELLLELFDDSYVLEEMAEDITASWKLLLDQLAKR